MNEFLLKDQNISAAGTTYSDEYSYDETAARVECSLNVSAASGTSPTLDITPQFSIDGENWFDGANDFTQATGTTTEMIENTSKVGVKMRFKYVVGGTDPDFTFDIAAAAKH